MGPIDEVTMIEHLTKVTIVAAHEPSSTKSKEQRKLLQTTRSPKPLLPLMFLMSHDAAHFGYAAAP